MTIFFTFAGTDESEAVSGAADDAAYHAKDDTITGTMRYHLGDDLPFVWRRVAVPKAISAVAKPRRRR